MTSPIARVALGWSALLVIAACAARTGSAPNSSLERAPGQTQNGDPAYDAVDEGLALRQSGDNAGALKQLQIAVRLQPDAWRLHALIMQCAEACGDVVVRDEHRRVLFELRKRGVPPDVDFFMRDRFNVRGREVDAFEHYELKPPENERYTFVLSDSAGNASFTVSLEAPDIDTAVGREGGVLGADQRWWLIEQAGPGQQYAHGPRTTFEPNYDEARTLATEWISNVLAWPPE